MRPHCIFWGPWILTQWLSLGHAGPTRTRQPQCSRLGTLLSPRASLCATPCAVNMTPDATHGDPGQEEHRVASSPSGLVKGELCAHPRDWGFRGGFLSSFFQELSRARVFCVQHGSRRGILSQDFPCIFCGPA